MTGRDSGPAGHVEEAPAAPPRIGGVESAITAFVGRAASGPVEEPTTVTSDAEFARRFGGLTHGSTLGHLVRDFFANGGHTAIVVRLRESRRFGRRLPPSSDPLGSGPGSGTGLYALERVDRVGLLVIAPDAVGRGRTGLSPTVVAAAAGFCEQRRAMLLLDPPPTWTDPGAVAALDVGAALGTHSPNAAAYLPWLVEPDPLRSGAPHTVPPSGAVAGLIARIDAERGVWASPAGVSASLRGVTDLAAALDDHGCGLLAPTGINPIRRLRGDIVVWGGRTLAGADPSPSEWRYVAVRRLALYIEESLARGLQWVVFEPNDEPLWARIRSSVEDFLLGLFRAGALQGRTAREAFFVRCGRDTTTQGDLDNGLVVVEVGFAPLKPAEFVIIRIGQRTGSG